MCGGRGHDSGGVAFETLEVPQVLANTVRLLAFVGMVGKILCQYIGGNDAGGGAFKRLRGVICWRFQGSSKCGLMIAPVCAVDHTGRIRPLIRRMAVDQTSRTRTSYPHEAMAETYTLSDGGWR